MRLFHIKSDKKELFLKRPIEVDVTFKNGVWTYENKDLNIVCASINYLEGIREFHEEILFVWEEYGKEDDAKLTEGAKQLKKRIQHYVGQGNNGQSQQ